MVNVVGRVSTGPVTEWLRHGHPGSNNSAHMKLVTFYTTVISWMTRALYIEVELAAAPSQAQNSSCS